MDPTVRARQLLGVTDADLDRAVRSVEALERFRRKVKRAFKRAVKSVHPDVGGDTATFTAVMDLYRTVEVLRVDPRRQPKAQPRRPGKAKPAPKPTPQSTVADDDDDHRIWILQVQLKDLQVEVLDLQRRLHRSMAVAAQASDKIASLSQQLDRKGRVLDDLLWRARCPSGSRIDEHNCHGCRCRGVDKRVFGL